MMELSEGALTKIANGVDVDKPIIQILGHKKLNTNANGNRYRLLVSDGTTINSFTMLAIQLNHMITDNILCEFTVCQVTRYAISVVNRGGKEQRVMILLGVEILAPGSEVGRRIGNPTNDTPGDTDSERPSAASLQASSAAPPRKPAATVAPNKVNVETSGDIATTPISALSPYQNSWVIKARVVAKSTIRTWSNSRGDGKLFTTDFLDESGEIRCTAFKNQVDKFYDMIEVGNVYYISRCQIKTANKQFNNLKNEYELTMTQSTEIMPCLEESSEVPTIQYNFVPISSIENLEKGALLDALGIIKTIYNSTPITAKITGKELHKKNVIIVDESSSMVCLTLWGEGATNFQGHENAVLAIKGARVGEFNGGKSLSSLNTSLIQINPDIEEAHRLRGWYSSVGDNQNFKSLARTGGGVEAKWVTVDEMLTNALQDRVTVYKIKAHVYLDRVENSLYKACPTDNCNKKVVDVGNEMYRCEKCQREFPNYKPRLIATVNLFDYSACYYCSAFGEVAEKVVGMTAHELNELQANDHDAYLEQFSKQHRKEVICKVRTKIEISDDGPKVSATIVDILPFDHESYSKELISRLQKVVEAIKAAKTAKAAKAAEAAEVGEVGEVGEA